MVPIIDSMAAAGIVSLRGMMTGQMLAGRHFMGADATLRLDRLVKRRA
jgi:ABC-type iron transport system FetAB permease component